MNRKVPDNTRGVPDMKDAESKSHQQNGQVDVCPAFPNSIMINEENDKNAEDDTTVNDDQE
jgi:hypothetical protein